MTQEQKAKAYDEALERARQIHNERKAQCFDVMVKVFPELAESEDERIRKEILNYLYNSHDDILLKNKDKWIAYLEKQGEQKLTQLSQEELDRLEKEIVRLSSLNLDVNKDSKEISLWKSYFLSLAYKQKPADKVEPKFKAGDKIISTISNIPYYITEVCNGHYLTDVGCIIMFNAQDSFELVEQKPVEWSEEDATLLNDCVCAIQAADEVDYSIENKAELIGWLKSLKPQPKQGWSEEDEGWLDNAIVSCEQCGNTDTADWLKSLRPQKKQEHIEPSWLDEANNDEELLIAIEALEKAGQHDSALWVKHLADSYPQSTWKPSEEQMLAISTAINVLGKGTLNGKQLIELQEQLKKLKE